MRFPNWLIKLVFGIELFSSLSCAPKIDLADRVKRELLKESNRRVGNEYGKVYEKGEGSAYIKFVDRNGNREVDREELFTMEVHFPEGNKKIFEVFYDLGADNALDGYHAHVRNPLGGYDCVQYSSDNAEELGSVQSAYNESIKKFIGSK